MRSNDKNPKVLQKLAKDTGGEAYFPDSAKDVVSICKEIAADIRHQYDLTYSPTGDESAGFHKIRVTVTASGRGKLVVRSRTGYFFPGNTPDASGTPQRSAVRQGGG